MIDLFETSILELNDFFSRQEYEEKLLLHLASDGYLLKKASYHDEKLIKALVWDRSLPQLSYYLAIDPIWRAHISFHVHLEVAVKHGHVDNLFTLLEEPGALNYYECLMKVSIQQGDNLFLERISTMYELIPPL